MCIRDRLWRSLTAEWSGAAPQLKQAKARRFQEPPRSKDVADLWAKLPAWERLGEEVLSTGLELPKWMRSAALERLLPQPLLNTLVARPELATYETRLAWIQTQMEYARGQAQATAYAPGSGKDANGDVHMNSVEGPPGIAPDAVEGLSWALAESVQAGDWDLAEQLQNTIYAMKGSKGGFRKGFGKGKSGKGGAAPAAAAKGGAEFQGTCRHCGNWGHRMAECRKLTQELGKAGGSKAKVGGKGGPKGGKGPLAAPLAAVADDDHSAAQMPVGAIEPGRQIARQVSEDVDARPFRFQIPVDG